MARPHLILTAAAAAVTLGALLLAGCDGSRPGAGNSAGGQARAAEETRRLVVGTGSTGGVFYPYGSGIARILQEKMPATQATAEVTGGSVDNLKLLAGGRAELGLTTADSAYEAAQGRGVYADVGKVDVKTLAALYTSYVHIVARADSGIAGVADMRGKVVSVGSAGSSTEVLARRVLEAAGLDAEADIKRQALSVVDSVKQMKDMKIDAFFWIGGLPTAAVTDLVVSGTQVRFLEGAGYVERIRDKHGPLYSSFTLPADTYKGVDAPVAGIGVGNLLVVGGGMEESLAYEITRTLFEHLGELHGIHAEAAGLTLEGAAAGSSVPYHPGAIRYFRERGVMK